jgi:ATP phosphoribosyltransferase regulatory subunit
MIALKLCNEKRLYYIENCIRYLPQKAISQREFWQAGAELIGEYGPEADAEVICLALESLDKIGLKANIDIGSISVFKKIANHFNIKDIDKLRIAISSKSISEVKEIINNEEALKIFSYIIENRGRIEILENIAKMNIHELYDDINYIEKLFDIIKDYGYYDRVVIDLSTLREMKYYNGIVFDIFIEGLGIPIGGGGRYDDMMKEFGLDLKATGFAINIDLIVKLIEKIPIKKERIINVYYKEGYLEKAIDIIKNMRNKGIKCSLSLYRGEKEGILISDNIIDLKTGEEINERNYISNSK